MRYYLLIFLIVSCVFRIHAQPLRFGINAGFNASNYKADANTIPKPGFHIGATAEYSISDLISIQPEMLFTLKGDSNRDPYYLEIPVHLKFTFPLQSRKWYLSAGGYWAYGLYGKDKYRVGVFQRNYLMRYDYGAVVGAGYEVTDNLLFGLSYSYGLANMIDVKGLDWSAESLALSIYFRF
ncbi:MAG: porin family protein [Bacteroidales bacterium]|nr:porin family protein [Bacteroidales bacterium]